MLYTPVANSAVNKDIYTDMDDAMQIDTPTSSVSLNRVQVFTDERRPVRPAPENTLYKANIVLLDPVPLNPASVDSVAKVLDIIAVKLNIGTGPGQRRWAWISVDGIPFSRITTLHGQGRYLWARPIYGALHEELNMTQAWAELAFGASYDSFGISQGLSSTRARASVRQARDLHRARDLQLTYAAGVGRFLAGLYLGTAIATPTAESFRAWLDGPARTDAGIASLWMQLRLLLAVLALHDAVRSNEPVLKSAARAAYAPVWWARNHPIMRRVIIEDERTRVTASPEARAQLDRNTAARRHETYQGLDALLEEVNKLLKEWAGRVPDPARWTWASRSLPILQRLRSCLERALSICRTDTGAPRNRRSDDTEVAAWLAALRASPLATFTPGRTVVNVAGAPLPEDFLRLWQEGDARRRRTVCDLVLPGLKIHSKGAPLPVPTTLEEVYEQTLARSTTKKDLVQQIRDAAVAAGKELTAAQERRLVAKSKKALLVQVLEARQRAAFLEDNASVDDLDDAAAAPDDTNASLTDATGASQTQPLVLDIDAL